MVHHLRAKVGLVTEKNVTGWGIMFIYDMVLRCAGTSTTVHPLSYLAINR